MKPGQIFCFRPNDTDNPIPFGPMHADLTQAKVWAKAQATTVGVGDVIGFARVERIATVRVRAIDLDFGDEGKDGLTSGDLPAIGDTAAQA